MELCPQPRSPRCRGADLRVFAGQAVGTARQQQRTGLAWERVMGAPKHPKSHDLSIQTDGLWGIPHFYHFEKAYNYV